jgi:hypothetical protein
MPPLLNEQGDTKRIFNQLHLMTDGPPQTSLVPLPPPSALCHLSAALPARSVSP